MENKTQQVESNEVAKAKRKVGTAYHVKRLSGAINEIVETDLVTDEQRSELWDIITEVKMKYLNG